MPRLVEDTLLVVAPFESAGVEYLAGDRVPTRHRAIRRIAAASPQLFAMEYGSEPLDLEWLASIEAEAEGRFKAVKRQREAEKRERALRQEFKEQDAPQPELERRFKEQEDERKRREQEAGEEREEVEKEIALVGYGYQSGFNF